MSRKSNNEVFIESLETQYKTVITDGCAQQTALMGADTTTTAANVWPLITQIVATNQSIVNRNGTQEDAYIEDMNEWTICEEVVVVKEEKECDIESTEDQSMTAEDIVNDGQIETDTGSDGCVNNTNVEKDIKKETEDTDYKPIITDEYIADRTVTTYSWPLVTEIHAINHSIVNTFLTQEDGYIADTNEWTIPEVVVKEEVNEVEEESALVMSASVLREKLADKADCLTDPSTSLPLKPFACDYDDCHFRAINQLLLDSHRESHETSDHICGYDDCGRSFIHERALKIHQQKSGHCDNTDDMAIPGPPYGCQWPDCTKAFKNKWMLKRHVNGVHSHVRSFECHDCPKRFLSNSELCKHRRQKHSLEPIVPKKEFKCDYNDCQYETTSLSNLDDHKKRHLNIKELFKCDYNDCQFVTNISSSLCRHRKRHQWLKKFICEKTDCAMSFVTNGDLKRHMLSHSDVRPHRCDWPGCESAYKQANTLANHRRKHHTRDEHSDGSDNKRPKCDVSGCSYVTDSKSSFVIHGLKHQNVRPFVCEETDCGKSFHRKDSLNRHKRCHSYESDNKRHKCDVSGCSYGTNNRSSFVIHGLKHQNVRPFVCEETDCGMSFDRKDSLNRHKRCHSDERSYRCDWPACESTYKSGRQLRDHRRSHTGEREFKCPFAGCGKCYATRNMLNSHKNNHKHPYVCHWPECDQTFAYKGRFKAHVNEHQGIRPHKCHFSGCDKSYFSKPSLNWHLKTVHKMVLS